MEYFWVPSPPQLKGEGEGVLESLNHPPIKFKKTRCPKSNWMGTSIHSLLPPSFCFQCVNITKLILSLKNECGTVATLVLHQN